jgi:hypothetical protein
MLGNVWGWCLNEYGQGRALRGGGMISQAVNLRPGVRNWFDPGFRNYFLGFRVAAVPSGPELQDKSRVPESSIAELNNLFQQGELRATRELLEKLVGSYPNDPRIIQIQNLVNLVDE